MAAHALRPFSFSLLPRSSSRTEQIRTVDLISSLSAAPEQASFSGGGGLPEWVERVAAQKGAAFAWKVMEKEMYVSDASKQQNRLLIRKQVVDDLIIPAMTDEEISAANLSRSARQRLEDRAAEKTGERKQGREHGGLEVMVYNRNGWGCSLYLTRWDASKASVLKGGNYGEFSRRSYLAAGDLVEMWAFRDGDGRLCFLIGNKLDPDFSLSI